MDKVTASLVAVMVLLGLTGGLYLAVFYEEESDDKTAPAVIDDPFTFNWTVPNGTYYHFDGGLDAGVWWTNLSANLTGDNAPFWANGTYYGIGTHTFEPTIGVTSSGALFITSHRGAGEGTHIFRSRDQAQTWEDVTPPGNAPNSNDPYIYVDPWTDRIVKFDMHALLGMTVEIRIAGTADRNGSSAVPGDSTTNPPSRSPNSTHPAARRAFRIASACRSCSVSNGHPVSTRRRRLPDRCRLGNQVATIAWGSR